MEILSSEPRRKHRKRRTPRDESAQPSAFPSSEPVTAERLEEDAAEKKKVIEAAKAIPEIFKPEQIEWVFDVYVGIISFVYSLVLKIEFDAIFDELQFGKEQKEELAKPLARILSKHAPAEWAGMTDEIQLITMMSIFTVASFQRAKNVQRKLEEKKKDEQRTRPVDPIRREPMREIHVPA